MGVLVLRILVAVLLAAAVLGEAAQAQPPRPNIVVLETDDQTVESLRVMGNVQRLLMAEGTTFDNSFVANSLCCPSRATLLTGQYSHNNGVFSNTLPSGGYYRLNNANTLAVWLQRAGYYTAHLGKYLNGYGTRNAREIPPGYSEWHGTVDPSTYRFYQTTFNDNGTLNTTGTDPGSYLTDVVASRASEMVRRMAASSQPFFLWTAFLAPHSGGPRESDDPPANTGVATPVPAPRHRNRFAAEPLPLPPSFNEADMSDKPRSMRRRPRLGARRIAAIREAYQQRLESLLAVDEAVATIVENLRQTGELDNTVIILTDDNGFFHGEHRVPTGKVLLYEPSIRVPLIVRGPGFPRGVRRGQLVANVDLAPTILQLARAPAGRTIDGRSLLRLAADRGVEYGRDILIERAPAAAAANFTAIRSRNFLYAEYGNGDTELYDLRRDPFQLVSRHADPAYSLIRLALAARLRVLRRCSGRACSAGPRVLLGFRFRPRRVGGTRCAPGAVRVNLAASGAARTAAALFYVDGRFAGRDTSRPFVRTISRAALRPGADSELRTIRARVTLGDDRVATVERRVRVCGTS
jgi:N-acetylglucosamine-6-sulfatase